MTDRDTGRSRGFGFVEMIDDVEAEKAIAALNGRQLEGRAMNVNEAPPKVDRGYDKDAFRANAGSFRSREPRWVGFMLTAPDLAQQPGRGTPMPARQHSFLGSAHALLITERNRSQPMGLDGATSARWRPTKPGGRARADRRVYRDVGSADGSRPGWLCQLARAARPP